MNSKLVCDEQTARINLERALGRADVVLASDNIESEKCAEFLDILKEGAQDYSVAVEKVCEEFQEYGFVSRMTEIKMLAESLLENRCPRTIASLKREYDRNFKRTLSNEFSGAGSSEKSHQNYEYHSMSVSGLVEPESSMLQNSSTHFNSPLTKDLEGSENQGILDTLSQKRSGCRREAPTTSMLRERLETAERNLRDTCTQSESRTADQNPSLEAYPKNIETARLLYSDAANKLQERLRRDGCSSEGSRLKEEHDKMTRIADRQLLRCVSLPQCQDVVEEPLLDLPNESRTSLPSPFTKRLQNLHSSDKNSKSGFKPEVEVPEMINKFAELKLTKTDDQSKENPQTSRHLSYMESVKENVTKSNSLQYLLFAETYLAEELKQVVERAESVCKRTGMTESQLSNILELEEKFCSASYRLQNKYESVGCKQDASDVAKYRATLRSQVRSVTVDVSRSSWKVSAEARPATMCNYNKEPSTSWKHSEPDHRHSNYDYFREDNELRYERENFVPNMLNVREPTYSRTHRVPDADPRLKRQIRQELLRGVGDPFDGKPEQFWAWKTRLLPQMVEAQTSSLDNLYILLSNTAGRPKQMIRDLLTDCYEPDETLNYAWKELEKKFGTKMKVSQRLLERLKDFPAIDHPSQLQDMEDLLSLCRSIMSAMRTCRDLQVLNYRSGWESILRKMPSEFVKKWCRFTARLDGIPNFNMLFDEISIYIDENSDPIIADRHNPARARTHKTLATSHHVFNDESREDYANKGTQTLEPVFSNSRAEKARCPFHNSRTHDLVNCYEFSKLSFNRKWDFAIEKNLCFKCLGNHISRSCEAGASCSICQRDHIDLMHKDATEKPRISSNQPASRSSCTVVCGSPGQTSACRSKTLAVEVRQKGSSNSLKCYCIIDEQSTASFCDPQVSEILKVKAVRSSYTLSTLSGQSTPMSGFLVDNLEVRGLEEKNWIDLPGLHTHPFIPDTVSEVAIRQEVAAHCHIKNLADNFPETRANFDVKLLLGVNCGPAMKTKVYGEEYPFVHHTALGWSLVGPVRKNHKTSRVCKILRTTVTDCHLRYGAKQCFGQFPRAYFIPRKF